MNVLRTLLSLEVLFSIEGTLLSNRVKCIPHPSPLERNRAYLYNSKALACMSLIWWKVWLWKKSNCERCCLKIASPCSRYACASRTRWRALRWALTARSSSGTSSLENCSELGRNLRRRPADKKEFVELYFIQKFSAMKWLRNSNL